ncbi:MAG: hypothetical protein JSS53_08440, partial [Proteobacteria bacterium]|nr:hypothetical protein [Pseudomonadota bacterium]
SEYPVQKLQEKWLMLYRLPKDCDKNCSHAMHHMRQVQKSLGKDFYRIKIVLITDDFKNNLSFLETNASSVETPKDNTVVLLSFKSDARSSQQTIGRDTLYIVDPLGNIILKYSENWAMRDLYKDLQRLFKTSQIG